MAPASLVDWILELSHPDSSVRRRAAQYLRDAGQKGIDLSSAVSALERACKKEDASVRPFAPEALSIHYRSTKSEEALLSKIESLPSFWSASVSHRASHGMPVQEIDPGKEAGLNALDGHLRRCALCLSHRVQCIHSDSLSSIAGKWLLFEFCCEECGKFTLYEYAN